MLGEMCSGVVRLWPCIGVSQVSLGKTSCGAIKTTALSWKYSKCEDKLFRKDGVLGGSVFNMLQCKAQLSAQKLFNN